MKKPDLIKQLANRINQPHVIESWINKIEKAAYNKGYKDKDAESKQLIIADVSQQRGLLIADMIKMIKGYTDEEVNTVCKQRNGMYGSNL